MQQKTSYLIIIKLNSNKTQTEIIHNCFTKINQPQAEKIKIIFQEITNM